MPEKDFRLSEPPSSGLWIRWSVGFAGLCSMMVGWFLENLVHGGAGPLFWGPVIVGLLMIAGAFLVSVPGPAHQDSEEVSKIQPPG